MLLDSVVRDSGVTIRKPVALRITGAGRNHQQFLLFGYIFSDESFCFIGNRKIPYRLLDIEPDTAGKRQVTLYLVFEAGLGNRMGHEQSVQIPGP